MFLYKALGLDYYAGNDGYHGISLKLSISILKIFLGHEFFLFSADCLTNID